MEPRKRHAALLLNDIIISYHIDVFIDSTDAKTSTFQAKFIFIHPLNVVILHSPMEILYNIFFLKG